MELPVFLQLRELGLALVFGVAAGLVYDLLRPLRRGVWSTGLVDAFYALLLLPALLLFALYAGRGRLRLFALIAMALSDSLWLWGISPLFRRLECRRRSFIRRLTRKIHFCHEQKKKNSEKEKNS
ncbi:MAG: hypothetical protein IIY70_06115 [Oscillospiraceae bacterium]|nr:hypothetical protein [Oscillospiraceae bacterium]